MKKIILLVVLVSAFAAAPMGLSQTSGSTSTSTNTINATVFAAGGGQASAMPGVSGTPGVFSGFPEENTAYQPYWNPLYQENTVSEIETSRGKHDKVIFVPRVENAIADNSDPIWMLSWSPFTNPHYQNGKVTDQVIAIITVVGKTDEPLEAALAAGLWEAKEKTHTRRVVVFLRNLNVGVTKGFSIGTGQAAGMIMSPGANNPSVALATGGLLGKNTTRQENVPEFRIVCLNDGPFDPPPPPESPKQTTTEVPPAPQPPQPESKAPPVQTIRIEVVTTPSAQTSVASPTTNAPASTPAITAAIPVASCDLPAFVVDFGFNESNVKEEFRTSIKSTGQWLKNHPNCNIQVEGHASTEGSFAFNAALARLRAKAVYDILAEDRDIQNQLVQFVSLSKDRAASERNPADRRVILRVVGNASGR